jgi:sialic acid synthase SpsE
VGAEHPCFIIAEAGINHNGDLGIAHKLLDMVVDAGCDAVKFQKRVPELCVPRSQWEVFRETPWGVMTYLDYRRRIELGESEYREIDSHARARGIAWFASCWDEPSVDFIARFDPPCFKIASASLTDDSLLRHVRAQGKPIILSTGGSTQEQVDHAVDVLGTHDLAILHSCSAYPASYEELNLRVITTFHERYPGVPIGYSGHETGLPSTVAAVALGACIVERHVTLDRAMWGTDQSASLGPSGVQRLVRDIRLAEAAFGRGEKFASDREIAVMSKLRRVP